MRGHPSDALSFYIHAAIGKISFKTPKITAEIAAASRKPLANAPALRRQLRVVMLILIPDIKPSAAQQTDQRREQKPDHRDISHADPSLCFHHSITDSHAAVKLKKIYNRTGADFHKTQLFMCNYLYT